MTGWRKKQIDRAVQEHEYEIEQIISHYSEEYDAYYNPETNEWIDSKCSDPTCEYCTKRPEKPL